VVNTLFRFVGSAIGQAIAGMFMQANQITIHTAYYNKIISFPSVESFEKIFLCISILAAFNILLSLLIKKQDNSVENLNKKLLIKSNIYYLLLQLDLLSIFR
jgi:phosphotransferase system  glucose/maltose/N-acetylglucosamine-specific IIC component